MFGQLGMGEIVLIMVVILLLFGAKRIPEIAGSFGKGIREFKKSVNEMDRSIREEVREPRLDEPRLDDRVGPGRDPAATRAQEDADRPAPTRLLN